MEKYGSAQYWSESQKQFIHVDAMALPYARNVFAKLMRDDQAAFEGSLLNKALVDRLCPSDGVIQTLLATKGEVSYWIGYTEGDGNEIQSIRKRFYAVGKKLGVKVTTEKDDKGDWLVARCEPIGMSVNVTRH